MALPVPLDVEIPAFPVANAFGHDIPGAVCSLFAWDPRLILSTLVEYVLADVEDAMVFVAVPGDARQCKDVSSRVRCSVAALFRWMSRLHLHNFCLSGPINPAQFVVLHNGSVKGTRALLEMLVPLHDDLRSQNMSWLAEFARDDLYQTAAFGNPPPEVADLLDILTHFTPDHYILVISHPALADAIGKSALFTQHYGKLMSLEQSNPTRYNNIIASININNLGWISRAMQNLFLHQLMRFRSGTGALVLRIKGFLCNGISCGVGAKVDCLTLRRNGESHLLQDYCADGDRTGAGLGTQEAFNAALAAAIRKKPALANLPANPLDFTAIEPYLDPPFTKDEAQEIARTIIDELQKYINNRDRAEAAATAAAEYIAAQPFIYLPKTPALPSFGQPAPVGPHNRVTKRQIFAYRTAQQLIYIQSYQNQRTAAEAEATNAAMQVQTPPNPILARNMFNVKDTSNFFNLVEPRLLCSLHRAMFDEQELQMLDWHWDYEGVNLPT